MGIKYYPLAAAQATQHELAKEFGTSQVINICVCSTLKFEIDFDLLKNNKIVSWDSIPVDYNLGRCSDFYGGNLKGISEKITYL